MRTIRLGVNIDHVATLRQARGTEYPDPVQAAAVAEQAGANGITLHLREDRRHIQEADVVTLRQRLKTPMNLEAAVTPDMLAFIEKVRPAHCCLVPEKREELTTEGGLDVVAGGSRIADACTRLAAAGVRVSLFIDPDRAQIDAAVAAGAPVVELHTGAYADAVSDGETALELTKLSVAAQHAVACGLEVHAGHGLHYANVRAIAALPELQELNIGHAIIARAVFSGLAQAVTDMKRLMLGARR